MKKLIIIFLVLAVLASAKTLGTGEVIQGEIGIATSTVAYPPIEFITEPIEKPLELKRLPEASFAWPPELRRICSCESTGKPGNEPKQFNDDGSVLRGKVNPLDTGMCQINLKYHGAAADRLGLDLETASGNFAYAVRLYNKEGTQPWTWSRSCWAE
jgi:hypothetical protein